MKNKLPTNHTNCTNKECSHQLDCGCAGCMAFWERVNRAGFSPLDRLRAFKMTTISPSPATIQRTPLKPAARPPNAGARAGAIKGSSKKYVVGVFKARRVCVSARRAGFAGTKRTKGTQV